MRTFPKTLFQFSAESNQAIMLITDGIPSSEDDVFQEHNQPHKVMMMETMRMMRMRMMLLEVMTMLTMMRMRMRMIA